MVNTLLQIRLIIVAANWSKFVFPSLPAIIGTIIAGTSYLVQLKLASVSVSRFSFPSSSLAVGQQKLSRIHFLRKKKSDSLIYLLIAV